jgi:hypothetical protein
MSRTSFLTPGSRDALQTVVDAWDTAVQAARNGASKARAGQALPAATRFLSRVVYTMSYSFSYGFVFPVSFVAKSLPADNAILTGIVDGARAANDWVDELKHLEPEQPPPVKRGRPRTGAKATRKKSGR